jgi:hypothetical protein
MNRTNAPSEPRQYPGPVDAPGALKVLLPSGAADRLLPPVSWKVAVEKCTGYRYEQLMEALAYARITLSRPVDATETRAHEQVAAPTGSERAVMSSLGIEFDGRAFRMAGYRYQRLADAVNYARRGGEAAGRVPANATPPPA